MFKTQTKKIKLLILLWALLGLIRSIFFLRKDVFAWVSNLLQEILNVIESNQPIEAIFEGKITESIYEKALEAEKVEIAKITNATLEDMQFINSWFTIKKEDLLNILYYSNNNISYAMNKICKNKKSCNITRKDISKSYGNAIEELHKAKIISTDNNNVITRAKVDNRVNNNFILLSNNKSSFKQFETASIWEDLFINGVLEDGDYDLQIDMENIGNLLFESFISPIETVFYKLPTSKKGSATNWQNTPTNNNNETIKDILQKAINQINTGVITNWGIWWNTWWQNPITKNSQTTNMQTTTDLDSDLKNFIVQNKVTQQEERQKIWWVAGDICREEIQGNEIVSQVEETTTTPSFQEIENYLKETQNEILSYANTYPENQIAPNINNILSGMNTNQANAFVEDYINDFFNTESTESCLKSCNSLPASEKVICQIQCLCFTMWRPSDKDPRVKSMNEMLKLRFCMVPAKSIAIPRGKDIYSLDDILERIKANMEDTIQWGQMVKFQKTKEFLDNPIADLKRDKIISFQINVNMKPLFSNKSALAKKDQEKTALEKLEEASGKEQSPWTNNNKYVIVQDIAKNKIYKEYAWSFEEYQNKYNQELERINQEKNEKEKSFKQTNVINDQKASFLTTLTDFLDKNLAFRKETEKKLQNINNVVNALESKL